MVMLTLALPRRLADDVAVGEVGGGKILAPIGVRPGLGGRHGVGSLHPSEKAGTQEVVL